MERSTRISEAIQAIQVDLFDPSVMATERAAVAAMFLGALLWRQHATAQRTRMNRRQLGTALGCAVLMVYLNQMLVAGGLARTTATNGSIAIALSPLVSSLMAAAILRERIGPIHLSPWHVVGLLAVTAGAALGTYSRA